MVRRRPRMPSGYGISSTQQGMLEWAHVVARLREAHNYWIVTSRLDGRPHAMPVWGLWSEGAFWFSTDPGSRKARNLDSNPEVVVHLESGDDVVIVEGRGSRVATTQAPAQFVAGYRAKYGIELDLGDPAFALSKVAPRSAMGWLEKDYPQSATAWRPLPGDGDG